jgi:hypothetical protein
MVNPLGGRESAKQESSLTLNCRHSRTIPSNPSSISHLKIKIHPTLFRQLAQVEKREQKQPWKERQEQRRKWNH